MTIRTIVAGTAVTLFRRFRTLIETLKSADKSRSPQPPLSVPGQSEGGASQGSLPLRHPAVPVYASMTIGFSSASITAFRNSAPRAPSITR